MFNAATVRVFLPALLAGLGLSTIGCGDDASGDGGDGGSASTAAQSGGSSADGGAGTGASGDTGGSQGGAGGAPSAVLVDCQAAANAQDPKCQRVYSSEPGTIGAGPKIGGSTGFPDIQGGFVQQGQLIVAVEMGAQSDDNGIVLGVDLLTGDRKVLAGKYEDPTTGPVVVGTGPDLGYIFDVEPGPSGKWLAIVSKGSTEPKQIIEITAATGDRAIVWDSSTSGCEHVGWQLIPDYGSMAVGPDGAVYLPLTNNPASSGVGIARVSGGVCSVVTLSGSPDPTANKGMGPTIDGGAYDGLSFHDGKVWALHNMTESLMTIDPATGDRARISSSESSTLVGSGDAELGVQAVALASEVAFTVGGFVPDDFVGTAVTLATGDRTELSATAGPLSFGSESSPHVWLHPSGKQLLLDFENGIVVYDPATGNSNIVSY